MKELRTERQKSETAKEEEDENFLKKLQTELVYLKFI